MLSAEATDVLSIEPRETSPSPIISTNKEAASTSRKREPSFEGETQKTRHALTLQSATK